MVGYDQLDKLLNKITSFLDLPDSAYENAIVKYDELGCWLSEDTSELLQYKPEIYSQGSFKLGTIVRPINDKDDYDIDLVCRMEIKKESVTQKELKDLIGDRLKKNTDYSLRVSESRRCWRLDFPEDDTSPSFHLDILPAIPDIEKPPTGILITDVEMLRWQRSDPLAYFDWFSRQINVVSLKNRELYASGTQISVEDVPEWQIKTPLQKAIQILKRHRDIFFLNDEEKPTSIIITTLAALVYENQEGVFETLISIIPKIAQTINCENGKWIIQNPTNSQENFADKWNENPHLPEKFFKWIKRIEQDFLLLHQQTTLDLSIDFLGKILGKRVVENSSYELGYQTKIPEQTLRNFRVMVPDLGDTKHCVIPTWTIVQKYNAKIKGMVYPRKNSKSKWILTNRPVFKNLWIRFDVSTNAPAPYTVNWQVVNTGQEAIAANGLRGIFYNSDNGTPCTRWEQTSYKGTHWVEAFIIDNNNVCIARSGKTYVKIR